MPWYKVKDMGFWNGARIRPGERFHSEKALSPEPKWAELDEDCKAVAPKKSSKPKPKKGPAVAEGAEGMPGTVNHAESASDVDVI